MAGLTPDGFERKRLPTILDDIVQNERQKINNNIANTEDTLLGQINTILGAAIAEMWELAEAVNDSFNRRKAEGNALDDLGDLIGVPRLAASPSRGLIYIRADEGTTLLAGTEMEDPLTGNTVVASVSRNITASECEDVLLRVGRIVPNATYSVTVNDVVFSYPGGAGPDEETILKALGQDINNADLGANAIAGQNIAGEWTLYIGTTDTQRRRQISVERDAYLTYVWVGVRVPAETVENGPISVPSETITQLGTPVPGVQELINTDAFILGRLEESDEEYRERFSLTTRDGKATVNAITSALQAVSGVTHVQVYENVTKEDDGEGRPPSSIEAVVVGGTTAEVAQALFDAKAAGIETFGNTQVGVVDDQGNPSSVYITIPSTVYIAVQVTYTLYDEESFPLNGEAMIREAVYKYIEGLNVNVDVIPTRLYGPIYSSVKGIDSLYIEIQQIPISGSPPEPLDWQDTKLEIAYNEKAYTTTDDIYLIGPA